MRDERYCTASKHFSSYVWRLQGVTAVARLRMYPADHATNTPDRWVTHWAHPFEFELISKGPPPPPAKYPAIFLQVCVRACVCVCVCVDVTLLAYR